MTDADRTPEHSPESTTDAGRERSNFIRDLIDADLASRKHATVVTRFPPEPNGYLHIGHAKSICLNFGLAQAYGGRCHLRFDDTNPTAEEQEYVDSIIGDVRWLGFDWGEHLYFASDYFGQMHAWAVELVRKGKAYVCSLPRDVFSESHRGSIYEAGTPSPYRDRSVEENLALFERMRGGEFKEGEHVLRARIDMASPNMLMRDPPLYRILHAHHHRTGDTWCIYPMYDYAHCLEDAIEGVTHSICTLEFETNRELYDWVLQTVDTPSKPQQLEFARLNLGYTVMSKRKLLQLVRDGQVSGWDDPRMPTLAGMRRRGVTPASIRAFADMIGVAKANSTVDLEKLEYCIRDDLNHEAPRVMCVLEPLKVVITNYPQGEVEALEAPYWPHDVPREGSRELPFGREIYIERGDFMEEPPQRWHRLAPGREVRLRYAYFVTCDAVVKDADGRVVELRCTYDPATRGGDAPDGRKVKGTLHWVAAQGAVAVEARLYDRLFTVERPDGDPDKDFKEFLNPESLVTVQGAMIEPSMAAAEPGQHFQFERLGFFYTDPVDSRPGGLVFNRVVTLRDSWAKIARRDALPDEAVATTPAPAVSAKAAAAPSAPRVNERELARRMDALLAARFAHYQDALGVAADDADLLAGDPATAAFFDAAVASGVPARALANWYVNELMRDLKERPIDALPFGGEAFARLVGLVEAGHITAAAGKEVLAELVASGGEPAEIVDRRGLRRLEDDGAVAAAIASVIAGAPAEVERYRGGDKKLLGFFIGLAMRETRGKADANTVRTMLLEQLG